MPRPSRTFSRRDGLPDASPRQVAHGAAVIGRTFWKRVLARVKPDQDLDPPLATLERERFVSRVVMAEPAYSFAHALVQEVAYRTQLISQRRRTHVVVGDAFTELFGDRIEEFIDTLAFHYRRGEDDAKARTWLMRAGARAQRLYANTEALDYFGAAIERAGAEPAARAEAHEAVGDVFRVIARYTMRSPIRRALEIRAVGASLSRLTRKGAIVQQLRGDQTGRRNHREYSCAPRGTR